MTACHILSLAK